MGMLCVVFLLLFNSLSYFGTNRVFVLENMVASVLIVWIALPHTRKIITVCVLPVGIALLYTMLVVKQFNLETASEFSSSVISVKSLANTIEEYVNGPWCIAQSYAASRNLTFSTRSGALFADIGNGLGGIADLPIIKSIVSYTNQFHASSAIMKTAFETYDRGQMLSLSAGLFIPFGILGWIVYCEFLNRQYGTDYISVMPTNLYGPNDNYHPTHSHVVPALIRRFHEAKVDGVESVTCWGDGSPLREFLYVDDLANLCVFLMNNYSGNETVNAGTGKELTIKELTELVAKVVGYVGEIKWDTTKPNGTPRKLLDVSKATNIGWTYKTELEDGLRLSYEDFLNNPMRAER